MSLNFLETQYFCAQKCMEKDPFTLVYIGSKWAYRVVQRFIKVYKDVTVQCTVYTVVMYIYILIMD